jgi:hypothetical protein
MLVSIFAYSNERKLTVAEEQVIDEHFHLCSREELLQDHTPVSVVEIDVREEMVLSLHLLFHELVVLQVFNSLHLLLETNLYCKESRYRFNPMLQTKFLHLWTLSRTFRLHKQILNLTLLLQTFDLLDTILRCMFIMLPRKSFPAG